jgi:hypothetical protein
MAASRGTACISARLDVESDEDVPRPGARHLQPGTAEGGGTQAPKATLLAS